MQTDLHIWVGRITKQDGCFNKATNRSGPHHGILHSKTSTVKKLAFVFGQVKLLN